LYLRNMPWDRKYYKTIFKWVYGQLGTGLNPKIYTSLKEPVWQGSIFISMLPELIHREDYEGAQATKDAIVKWYNERLPKGKPPFTENDLIKIAPYEQREKIAGIICFGLRNDKSGLASGGVQIGLW